MPLFFVAILTPVCPKTQGVKYEDVCPLDLFFPDFQYFRHFFNITLKKAAPKTFGTAFRKKTATKKLPLSYGQVTFTVAGASTVLSAVTDIPVHVIVAPS